MMQQLRVNRKDYFELLRVGGIGGASGGVGGGARGGDAGEAVVEATATVDHGHGAQTNLVTFKSPEAYLIAKLKIHSLFNIYFQV